VRAVVRTGTAARPIALVAVAVAFTWPPWSAQRRWTSDSLFYEAQARELTGTPAAVAREEVFFGPIGRSVPDSRVRDRRHIAYAAPFYRRRWVVPALDAALKPFFGIRSLAIVSLLGYVLSGLFVYLLARRRFRAGVAFGAGLFTLWFPPLRTWAAYPLTDTMGVATLALALCAAHWSLSGRRSRLFAWGASIMLLAFTRDAAAIVVFAGLWVALARRTRRSLALVATGVLAAAPAPIFFGAPLRQQLALTFSRNDVPSDSSWHYILTHYRAHLDGLIAEFPFRANLPLTALLLGLLALLVTKPSLATRLNMIRRAAVVACLLVLALIALRVPLYLSALPEPLPAGILLLVALVPLFLPSNGETFIDLARGGAIGAVGYLLLLPDYTALRYPLVILPFAALGAARVIEAPARSAITKDVPAGIDVAVVGPAPT
jgi:4-amino-4-deoxy-L-arabinose transferase-like glycosyltransferase